VLDDARIRELNRAAARLLSSDDDTLRGASLCAFVAEDRVDGCQRDEDGDCWITGRVDDVINVSGHRLGEAEV
jgi:acyl-coenzyme A synthetase/AMP-(fatty) acid ligase